MPRSFLRNAIGLARHDSATVQNIMFQSATSTAYATNLLVPDALEEYVEKPLLGISGTGWLEPGALRAGDSELAETDVVNSLDSGEVRQIVRPTFGRIDFDLTDQFELECVSSLTGTVC